jgi:hypothetical protein
MAFPRDNSAVVNIDFKFASRILEFRLPPLIQSTIHISVPWNQVSWDESRLWVQHSDPQTQRQHTQGLQ